MTKFYYILLALVILYAIVLIAGCSLQDRLIFYPEKLEANYKYDLTANDTEVFIKSPDGELINAILYTRPANNNVVLYFHGNGGSLNSWQNISTEILSLNCNLLLTDYRGYGKNAAYYSEEGFYKDAQAAYDFLKSQGYKEERIIVYGRSLGSGIAVDLASKNKPKALILETPYSSFVKLANKQAPYLLPSLILKYRFNSIAKAPSISCPTIILHGTADEVIPYEQGKELYEALQSPKQLVTFPNGNHNNLSSFPEKESSLLKFIQNL